MTYSKRITVKLALLVIGLLLFSISRIDWHQDSVQAAANPLVVNSPLGGADANPGDGVCQTSTPGQCTLRAAIEEANADPDADIINFNITGTASFTSGGQSGYTIAPASQLPDITETVVIDGYSQPGATANTAVSPQPLNGRLLIELNGQSAPDGSQGLNIEVGESVEIKGLIINGWSDAVVVNGDNAVIAGNYIGTDHTGMSEKKNLNNGISGWGSGGNGLRLGGTAPADRNLISGNGDEDGGVGQGGAIGIGNGHNNWVIQGNYIGVGADGITAIPNAIPGGSGNPSVDYVSNTLIGGSEEGATNVISGNHGHGIAPYEAPNTRIEGNFIGVAYDGVTPLGNGGQGVTVGSNSENVQIVRNTISNNQKSGVGFYEGSDNGLVIGNKIEKNGEGGVMIMDTSNVQVGRAGQNEGNLINENTNVGVSILSFGEITDNNKIQNNIITGTKRPASGLSAGIATTLEVTNTLIGGENIGEGNTVSGNAMFGVAVQELTATAFSYTGTPKNTAIIGNSIHSNNFVESNLVQNNGLGIDILSSVDTSAVPDGNPEEFASTGPTPNDPADSDTGPNDYINYPVINTATQTGHQLSIDFSLDAAGSTNNNYRVEFFASDQADPSGYGEGQTFLGSTTVPNGTNQTASLNLPPGTDLTGKVLSATTTALNSATDTGFGSTSEFSRVTDINVVSTAANNLVKTGAQLAVTTFLSSLIVSTVIYTYIDYRRHKRPLLISDQELGVNTAHHYTYWHHLRNVSIPLAKYRLRLVVEERRKGETVSAG